MPIDESIANPQQHRRAAFHKQAALIENGWQPHAVLSTEPVSRRVKAAVDSAGQQRWTTHLAVPLCGVERRRAPGYAGSGGACSTKYVRRSRIRMCAQLMGWATQRGQQKCRFLDLERRSFNKIAILLH